MSWRENLPCNVCESFYSDSKKEGSFLDWRWEDTTEIDSKENGFIYFVLGEENLPYIQ